MIYNVKKKSASFKISYFSHAVLRWKNSFAWGEIKLFLFVSIMFDGNQAAQPDGGSILKQYLRTQWKK